MRGPLAIVNSQRRPSFNFKMELKITVDFVGYGYSLVVAHMLRMSKVLGLVPSALKKKKEKRRGGEGERKMEEEGRGGS